MPAQASNLYLKCPCLKNKTPTESISSPGSPLRIWFKESQSKSRNLLRNGQPQSLDLNQSLDLMRGLNKISDWPKDAKIISRTLCLYLCKTNKKIKYLKSESLHHQRQTQMKRKKYFTLALVRPLDSRRSLTNHIE